MPIAITATTGGDAHAPVFKVGPLDTDVVKVDVSTLTTSELDTAGFLKAGVPFLKTGLLVTAGAVFGVTIESIKIAASNSAADIAAAVDPFVTLGTFGTVNRDVAEDNLGRVLTAAEIAGFDLAGSTLKLTRT